ncbi:hypothetical protein OAD06_04320 [Flavobacteriaceae bacterium]|nr:hypothetical protein [Flavobacteriaceae bacterium]
MVYIRNIILGGIIGCVFGLMIGTIYDSKAMKYSKWKEEQKTKQIIFSVLGAIGGGVLGYKIANEEETD